MYRTNKIATLASIALLSSSFSGIAMSNTMGGAVNVAIIGEADTLDPMISSKDVVGNNIWLVSGVSDKSRKLS